MPNAPISRPPPQHSAATAPALRGPTRSSQPPQIAAETPSSTKNSVNIQPRSATFQSQFVTNNRLASPTRAPQKPSASAGQSIGLVMPMARDSGSQNTLKP